MNTLQIIVALCLSAFVSGTTLLKNNQSPQLTSLTGISIPAGTINAYFDKNAITHVPSNYFVNLPNLDLIILDQNQITSIDDHTWAGAPSVRVINLGKNKLTIIREHHFAGLPNLQILYLFSNLLHTIEANSFKDNVGLTKLWLNDNSLQTLEQSMFDLNNHPTNLNNFQMKDNPLDCDTLCWVKQAEQQGWLTVYDPSSTVCAGRTWDSLTECDVCTGTCLSDQHWRSFIIEQGAMTIIHDFGIFYFFRFLR